MAEILKLTKVKADGSLGKDPVEITHFGRLGAIKLCWAIWRVYGWGVRVEDISESAFYLLRQGIRVMKIEYIE